jgi:hypothetical protein
MKSKLTSEYRTERTGHLPPQRGGGARRRSKTPWAAPSAATARGRRLPRPLARRTPCHADLAWRPTGAPELGRPPAAAGEGRLGGAGEGRPLGHAWLWAAASRWASCRVRQQDTIVPTST